MIKLMFCITKLEKIPLDEFREIWAGEYKEMFIEFARLAKAHQLVFNLTLQVSANTEIMLQRGTLHPYDAVIEIFWPNAPVLMQEINKPEVQMKLKHLRRFGDTFIDLANSTQFFVEDNEENLLVN